MSTERDSEDGFGVELPNRPDYQDSTREDLDDSLLDAIAAADQLGNEYLSRVLRAELGCVRLDGDANE